MRPTRFATLPEVEARGAEPKGLLIVKIVSIVVAFALLAIAVSSVAFEVGPGRAIVRFQDELIGGHSIGLSVLLVFLLELWSLLALLFAVSVSFRAITGKRLFEAFRKRSDA
jgi:hypothetical protein